MKVLNLLKLFIALLFLIVNINAQVVTNTATLYSSVTQADNTIVPSVPIPITIVRTNGRITEISLNIGNVSSVSAGCSRICERRLNNICGIN